LLVFPLLGNQVIYKEGYVDTLVLPAARVWIAVRVIGVGVGEIKTAGPGSVDGRAKRERGRCWDEDRCDRIQCVEE